MSTYRKWMAGALGCTALGLAVASCGGTGGGGGQKGNPEDQFILNSNNSGALILNVNPTEVDANKSDRIGLVATLTDRFGNPIANITIVFSSDIPDITFIPGQTDPNTGREVGIATTDVNGNADVIAVAGSSPTGTGDIIGSGAIFAAAPPGFGLIAQQQVMLLDIGFIDADVFNVIPMMIDLVEPRPGTIVFFNIVGGTPPYLLKNENTLAGVATLSQHCGFGCTENGGTLCIGSPCQIDSDCNDPALPVADVCVGPIKRCLASCRGANCGGSRCDTDADCNDGSPTPADVCKDSGQSIAFTINSAPEAGTHLFTVEDSAGNSKDITVNVTFNCGNGVAGGDEQCDLASVSDSTCASFGFDPGCTLDEVLDGHCAAIGITDVTNATVNCQDCQLALTCEGTGSVPVPTSTAPGAPTSTPTPTATATGTATPTPSATASPTPTATATPGP